MLTLRPSGDRGYADHGWLKSFHTFSFAGYQDPAHMGFGPLRVINEDRIEPGTGFGTHGHRDMEIISYVMSGALAHRDNLGNEGRTEAGDVQVMHAGTGIVHAEMNLEPIPTRLFQIWIMPDKTGGAPGWGTRQFPREGDGLRLLASGQPEMGDALPLNADASVWAGSLAAGGEVRHAFGPGRGGYLVPINGAVTVDGVAVGPRDGVAISDLSEVTITAKDAVELVLVDIPV